MNIVLIQGPIRDFYFTPIRSFPLGLCYLAASLEKHGHQVKIIDCLCGGAVRHICCDKDFDYLKAYYKKSHLSPFGLFKDFYHYGWSFERIREELTKNKADVFGISCLFSAYADESLTVAKVVKGIHPESLVVLGGSHSQEFAESILRKEKAVDFIVLGEGEEVLPDLLGHLDEPENVKGIVYRKGSEIIKNDSKSFINDLDRLPWPARRLLDLDKFVINKKRYTPILTSRGCSMKCAFCSIPRFMGSNFRMRSIEDVCGEMKDCYEKHDIRIFDIEDDNLTLNRARALQLLERIQEEFKGKEIELTAMNGLYYQGLDRAIVQSLKKAGMKRINLSLVTTSRDTAGGLNRYLDLEQFKNTVEWSREAGFHITVYLILGLPGEEIEEMIKTLKFLAGLPVLIGPSMYYHVPGSDLFSRLENEEKVRKDNYRFFRSTAVFYEDDNFTRIDLMTLFRLTRMINFIKEMITDNSDQTLSLCIKEKINDLFGKGVYTEDDMLVAPQAVTEKDLGVFLLDKFYAEKKIYSFQKKPIEKGRSYQFIEENVSQRVMQEAGDILSI